MPGTRVVAGATSHVVGFELGAAGMNGCGPARTRSTTADGQLDLAAARWAVEAAEHHWVPVSALFVENTHMASGGVPWSLEALDEVAGLGLPVHLDGARLFNAEVATGISAATFAERATTLMCCLSKGLGAPVGSLLAGPAELMERARHERKRLGGAMRQAGVLAAPGLVALRDHVDRLADDHARARRLAEAVAERWPGALDPDAVLTNIVCWDHPAPLRGAGPPGGRRACWAARSGPTACGSSPTSTSTTTASSGPVGRSPRRPDRASDRADGAAAPAQPPQRLRLGYSRSCRHSPMARSTSTATTATPAAASTAPTTAPMAGATEESLVVWRSTKP